MAMNEWSFSRRPAVKRYPSRHPSARARTRASVAHMTSLGCHPRPLVLGLALVPLIVALNATLALRLGRSRVWAILSLFPFVPLVLCLQPPFRNKSDAPSPTWAGYTELSPGRACTWLPCRLRRLLL